MDILPIGYYRARALGAQLSYSKNKGTPQIEIEFELIDEPYHGRRVTYIGFFTDRTETRTLESLRYCGWTSDDLTDLAGLGTTEVQLDIGHEDYEGKTRAKVQWVNKLGGVGYGAPMDDKAKREFAARMKSKAAATRVTAATNGSGSGPSPAPIPGEDKLPF